MTDDYTPEDPAYDEEPEEEEDDYYPDYDTGDDEPYYVEPDTWRDEYEDFATEYCD